MKIIILGAGQVGSTLAEYLTSENNDITVVDISNEKLLSLQSKLDIRVIPGFASYPNILNNAGAADADMLIAVTNDDEINMTACQVAYSLFRIPTKIARIRSLKYLAHEKLFGDQGIPVDVLISPEQLVTNYIRRLIEYPDALQVLDFADNKIQLVAVKALLDGPLVGQALENLYQHMPHINANVVAIFRGNTSIPAKSNTIIQENDEVFFLAAPECIRQVMQELRHIDAPIKKIVLAGGGNIGARLAVSLEKKYRLKIIEHNKHRIELLAEQLEDAIILEGDASDKDLLLNEEIEHTDVFCAITNSDEVNILSAMLAKRLGARKVMALINHTAYVDVIESSGIDIAISPHHATVGSLLTHVRGKDVVKVHSLRRGAAEAIEAIAHGCKKTSSVIGLKSSKIPLPDGTTIGAIIRREEIFMQTENITVEPNDHLIIFLADKRKVAEVAKLFHIKD